MGRILLSNKICAEFAIRRPIASESICREITSLKKMIPILNEYTTLSKKTTLVAAFRTFVRNFPGDA